MMLEDVTFKKYKDINKKAFSWKVILHECNGDKIVVHDVLAYKKDAIKKMRRQSSSIEEFEDKLSTMMASQYWSRAEYEVVVHAWCGGDAELKIDVYDQLKLNWDKFVEYCYNYDFGSRPAKKQA